MAVSALDVHGHVFHVGVGDLVSMRNDGRSVIANHAVARTVHHQHGDAPLVDAIHRRKRGVLAAELAVVQP